MNVLVFNNCFNQLLDEVSKEQKQIFLIRDFNINKTYYSIKNSYW